MNSHSNRVSWRRVLVAGLIVTAAIAIYALWASGPTIDPAKPFEIEFGRGSGMAGLQTVRILENGEVILHRHQGVLYYRHQGIGGSPERATLQLTQHQIMELRKLVSAHSIPSLSNRYVDSNICDGTQWVLRLQQGELVKATCFSNKFPRNIESFSREFDALLDSAGLNAAIWKPVQADAPRHDQRLWDSLRTR